MNKTLRLGIGITVAIVTLPGSLPIAFGASGQTKSMMNQIYVGDHLHTMSVLGHRLFMTGHDGAGMSDDGGKTWVPMSSLNGADVMSWTTSSKTILAGGHNGLFTSTNAGLTFKKAKFYGSTSDVHAIGASGKYAYLGSPQVGFLMSSDGGHTWKIRNSKVGQNFMGSMLVDPKNPKRIIAPDMSAGLATSTDGGLTWSSLGGPGGPMAVAWNSKNIKEIASIGMMSSGISSDGGKTWNELRIPTGAAAIEYSLDGKKLLVGVLVGNKAQIYTSINEGKSWKSSVAVNSAKKVAAMDPNMPGMDHAQLASSKRPLALTLGTFGFGTFSVFLTALLVRRKDRAKIADKKLSLASRGAGK
jgi:photosystem II stability/assembly factor-like uncharacterized protein